MYDKESEQYRTMHNFLARIKARKVGGNKDDIYYLDNISHNFYVRFDLEPNDDLPEIYGTVDVYLLKPGVQPMHATDDEMIQIATSADVDKVIQILDCLDLDLNRNRTPSILSNE